MSKISILGAGAWGTALAIALSAQNEITIWSKSEKAVSEINNNRNSPRLPSITINDKIQATANIKLALESDIILYALPTEALRETLQNNNLKKGTSLVLCAKGIEQKSLKLLSEVAEETITGINIAILSGPNFADEIASGLPAAATLSCKNSVTGSELTKILGSKKLPYIFF